MLVLTRKPGQTVQIGNDVTVTILEVTGDRVRLGIAAPADVTILRGELAVWHDDSPAGTATVGPLAPRQSACPTS